MNDITNHSENELSLLVFNDETLYRMRRKSYFFETLKELFIYTEEQLEVLKNDLQADSEEN